MIRIGLLLALLTGCVEEFPTVVRLADGDADVLDASPADSALDAHVEADLAGDGAPADGMDPGDMPADMAADMAEDMADLPCMPSAERCNDVDDDCNGIVDDVDGLGEACTVGVGACEQAGATVCNVATGEIVCDAIGGERFEERCNGVDDDCDGAADEGFGLGDACSLGQGICAAPGVIVCAPDEQAVCDATPGPASEERCNALDDDCDGTTDEGFGLGEACAEGVGACERAGERVCADGGTACSATPGEPGEELCNTIDDDCDGTADEGFSLGDACAEGVGACAADGVIICDDAGAAVCDAAVGEPVDELCNAIDDDCDGTPDEGYGLGEACTVGVGQCVNSGVLLCRADAAACSVEPLPAQPEACNGLDDDCDGRVDEGDTCADLIVSNCQVWLGYQDNVNGGLSPLGSVGDCPRRSSDTDGLGEARCNSTRGDARFRSVPLKGGMDDNDILALRFVCDGGDAAVSAWTQASCQIALAYGDQAANADLEGLNPADCGDTFDANGLARGCVRTDHAGRFYPIRHTGRVNGDDKWAVAFTCSDPALPDRAAGVQSSVVVQLGLQWRGEALGVCGGRIDNAVEWRDSDAEGCPLVGADRGGRETCASSSGDGEFHAFGSARDPNQQLGSCWAFGVALKRR